MIFSYILYGLLWLYSLLPLRILYFFSDINYFLLYYLFKYRRRVVRKNLENSFPEKSKQEIVGIEKRYYHHLSDVFIEMYKMWHMSEKEMKRRCVFKNTEVVEQYFKQGKSVIGVLGHYGNWEWMSSYALWMSDKEDFYALYKPLHNKVFDRMMLKIRTRFRAKLVPRNDILRKIVESKRDGRLFLAGFIGDQIPNKANLNFWMDFLNQDTPVLIGTEKIARKFDLPVISLHPRCVKRGYYEIEMKDLCAEPGNLQRGELTVIHTRMLEEYIREVPEQWLWSHKRWKHTRQSIAADEK